MTVLWLLAVWFLLSPVLALGCAALITAGRGPQPTLTDRVPTEEIDAVGPRRDEVRPAAA